jgi:hypothetical protein
MSNKAIFLGPSIMPTFMNELALIDELAKNGSQVDVYYCSGDRKYCSAYRDAKYLKRKATCLVCKANIYSALISMKHGNIFFKPLYFKDPNFEFSVVKSKNKIEKHFDWDLQSSILSTIHVDFLDLDLTDRDYTQIKNNLADDTRSIKRITSNLLFEKYTSFYIYNGRSNYFDFLTQFCEKNDIDYVTYEYPYMSHQGLISYENFRVHNYGEVSTNLLNKSKALDDSQLKTGNARLQSRINNNSDTNLSLIPSYNIDQTKNLIPHILKDTDFIVFYASTEEEVAAIREVNEAGTLPQHLIISTLVEHLGKKFKVVVKIHPNMSKSNAQYVTDILNTEKNGALLILADDKFDTYELMKKASLVVVKGSFTGIEASYLGKCVINIGDTFYSKFPSINTVYNLEELQFTLDKFSNGELGGNVDYQRKDASRFMYAFLQPTNYLKNMEKISLYAGKLNDYRFLNLVNLLSRYVNRVMNRLNK